MHLLIILLVLVLLYSPSCLPFQVSPSPRLSLRRSPSPLNGLPVIQNWELTPAKTIKGTAKSFPDIANGEKVETSAVKSMARGTVETVTGSKYKLGREKKKPAPAGGRRGNNAAEAAVASKPSPRARGKQQQQASFLSPPASAVACTNAIVAGQYVVVKNSGFKSPSGKSKFYTACKVVAGSENIKAMGTKERDISLSPSISLQAGVDYDPSILYTLKCSSNSASITREAKNYGRVTSPLGVLSKLATLNAAPTIVRMYKDLREPDVNAAFMKLQRPGEAPTRVLVLETGEEDLKKYLARSGAVREKDLRSVLSSITLALQTLHSAGLVWTDLKVENLVVPFPPPARLVVKGIDLESAVRVGSDAVDYSPEVCPPEFAREYEKNGGEGFRVEKNYDLWSLGMLFYNVYTGRNYYGSRSPSQITKMLANAAFEPDFSDIDDERLRDLCQKLCRAGPRERLGLNGVLLHQFFTKSGFAKWSL